MSPYRYLCRWDIGPHTVSGESEGYAMESGGREGERGTVGRGSGFESYSEIKAISFTPRCLCLLEKTLKPLFLYTLEVKDPMQR